MSTEPCEDQDKKKLYMQRCAISPGFPPKTITQALFEDYGVREFRYCSHPATEKPQLYHLMPDPAASWVGQVVVFVSLCGNNGKNEKWWSDMFGFAGMEMIQSRRLKTRRPLWKEHLEVSNAAQAEELKWNIFLYTDRQRGRAHRPSSELILPEAQDENAVPNTLAAIAEATTAEGRDAAVKKACDAEDDCAFPGQPTKQSLQRASYRSKKPKSPSAVGPQGVSPGKPQPAGKSQQWNKLGVLGMVSQSITMAEAVKHKATQALASETWQTIALTYLTRSNAYSSTLFREEGPVSVLRRILPDFAASDPFFNWAPQIRRAGFAAHYPLHDEASSLEHHRAVLAMEAAAESTLLSIADSVQGRSWVQLSQLAGADAALLADLECALGSGGGLEGMGPDYWHSSGQRPLPLGARPGHAAAGLRECVAELSKSRQEAFTREYVIPDANSWALPLLVELFNVRYRYCETRKSAHPGAFIRNQVASDYTWVVKKVNEARRDAIASDLIPLVRYGKSLMAYAARLRGIAEVVGARSAPPVDSVITRAPAPRGQRNSALISSIKLMQGQHLESTLRFLAIFPEVPETCRRSAEVCQAALAAMKGDSHQAQATSCLVPTPSLSLATNEPEVFFSRQPRRKARAVRLAPREAPDSSDASEI